MTMSYDDTKVFVFLVLNHSPIAEVRQFLHRQLRQKLRSEGEFYDGVITHWQGIGLTSDQWREFLSRLPVRALRDGLDLPSLLAADQILSLPPATG